MKTDDCICRVQDFHHICNLPSPKQSSRNLFLEHLKDFRIDPSYYDLILTVDLGVYGKEILREYMKKEYKIDLKNKYLSELRVKNLEVGRLKKKLGGKENE